MNTRSLTLSISALSLALTGCQIDKLSPPLDSGLYVQPISSLNDDFIKGVDISTLIEVEANGGQFFDDQGKKQDPLHILKRNGVNWVRLRLWNDPYDVSWINEEWPDYGTTVGAVGGGTNDLDKTIQLATRAKLAGMKVLLDFHYSDFWADPGKQYIPDSWKDLPIQTGETAQLDWDGNTPLTDGEGNPITRPVYDCSAVEASLRDFTRDTLLTLHHRGLFPDMVQIGNEINNGLVYPCGGWTKYKPWTYEGGIALLQAGIQGVESAEEAAGIDTDIMLHLAEGGQKWDFQELFGAFDAAGLAYDVIGASYYPMWHGSLEGLADNLNNISSLTEKPVIVAEVSYAFTTENNDDPTPNSFSESDINNGKFLATEQGQATAVREVMNVVANVPDNLGMGIFYWEPTWIPVDGAGWISGEGNGWENQALFDYSGHELASMDVFWKVSSTEAVDLPTIVSIADITVTLNAGAAVSLPTAIEVLFSDDALRNMEVTWSETDLLSVDTATAGEYLVGGHINEDVPVTATVVIVDNVLVNESFEDATLAPWTISNSSGAFELYTTADANVYEGQQSLKFWCPNACTDRIEQTLTVANGTYLISAFSSGASAGTTGSQLTANNGSAEISLNGWAQWTETTLTVDVTDGSLTVGIQLDEATDSWGYIDRVRAIRQ